MKKNFSPNQVRIFSPDDLSKTWYVEHYFGGKRKRIYGTINQHDSFDRRMQEANAIKAKLIAEYVPAQPISTDEQLLWQYVESQRGRWRIKTYYTYSSVVRVFCTWVNGRQMTPTLIAHFFDDLAKRRHKVTYNKYIQRLKQLFQGIGKSHLIDGVERQKAYSTPAKYFQSKARQKLRETIKAQDPELWFFCQCVYYLFLRPNSELRLMKASDFDTDRWTVTVRAEISKNGKHELIAVPRVFRDELGAYLQRFRPSDYIFPGRHDANKPVSVNLLSSKHRKILDELGFSSAYKLYSWKHTGAIACVDAGVPPKILQLQMRHANLEMTDRYLRQLGYKDLAPIEDLFPSI